MVEMTLTSALLKNRLSSPGLMVPTVLTTVIGLLMRTTLMTGSSIRVAITT